MKYIFRLKKSEPQVFIGMDTHSGGYPYETDDVFQANQYSDIGKMQKYRKMFKKQLEWEICIIKDVVLEPVVEMLCEMCGQPSQVLKANFCFNCWSDVNE